MKLSELVQRLNALLLKHGNVDVFVEPFTKDELYWIHGMELDVDPKDQEKSLFLTVY